MRLPRGTARRVSDVEIGNLLRIHHDEFAARFDQVPHQRGEDLFRILDAERDLLSARQALATANRTLASDFVRLSIAAAANPGG